MHAHRPVRKWYPDDMWHDCNIPRWFPEPALTVFIVVVWNTIVNPLVIRFDAVRLRCIRTWYVTDRWVMNLIMGKKEMESWSTCLICDISLIKVQIKQYMHGYMRPCNSNYYSAMLSVRVSAKSHRGRCLSCTNHRVGQVLKMHHIAFILLSLLFLCCLLVV